MHSTVLDVPGFIFMGAGLLDPEHFVTLLGGVSTPLLNREYIGYWYCTYLHIEIRS